MKRAFQPGDEFRGYTIRRLLGKGGIGSVWLACRGEHAEPFAVKILDRDVARRKPEYVKRVDDFFAFTDKNNCKRVYEAILAAAKE